jgi:hypothetical protein
VLSDLPFRELLAALETGLSTWKWFPKIPEIREAVLGKQPTLSDQEETEAEAAWLHVLNYADHWHPDIGPYRDAPKLTGKESQALRVSGGIYRLWELQDEGGRDLTFMRKAFVDSYKRAVDVSCFLDLLRGPERKSLSAGGFQNIKGILGGKAQ